MMSNTLKITGQWWFPTSDIRFNGELTFCPTEGGKLTIFGPLESFVLLDESAKTTAENSNDKSKTTQKICESYDRMSLILGKDNDGKKVTAVYTLPPNNRSVIRPNYNYCERDFLIDLVFIGLNFEKIEDIKFEKVLVEYSHLNDWLHDFNLSGRTAMYAEKSEAKYVLEHFYGETKYIDIAEICSIEILSCPNIRINFGEKNQISNRIYVRFSSYHKKTIKDYITLKNIFNDFLNFVISHRVTTMRMIGEVQIRIDDHFIIEQVDVFYHNRISQKLNKVAVVSPYLLIYEDIENNFSDIIVRWYQLRKKMSATYDLYFGVMYNLDLYLSNSFLMLAEALEIYIGIISQENPDPILLSKVKRIDRICEMLEKASPLSEADREWVKVIMNDKKSLSFKEKMEKAYDLYSELLPKLSHVIGTKQEFSSKVTELRNRLTHGNINYDELGTEEMFWGCKDLQLILQLCILSELKFSKDQLKEITT